MKTTNETTVQHTAGPWTITDDGYAITGANGGTLIVETSKANWESIAATTAQGATLVRKHLPEVEANARLIASAPELLAALENITGLWADSDQTNGLAQIMARDAMTAIAKAKGL